MLENLLKGRVGVSSLQRENYLYLPINCMQKPKERKQKVQKIVNRNQDIEIVTHAGSETRKRCVFSLQGLKGRVCGFIQNPLRLSLAYVRLIEK